MNLGSLRREHLPLAVVLGLVLTGSAVYMYVQSGGPVVEADVQFVLPGKSKTRGIGHSWPVIVGNHEPEQWTPPLLPERLQAADQDNEELIQHIREHWVVPPYPTSQWNLGDERRVHFSQVGQSETVDKELRGLRDGFFIECGAGDGEYLSNSLFFEKYRNWIGILIEVDPATFSRIVQVKRHAYMVNACLSSTRTPTVMDYITLHTTNQTGQDLSQQGSSSSIKAQCFPLASILKAIGVYRIDYFSLDVDGSELNILNTIPFDQFHIRSFTIRTGFEGNDERTEQHRDAIRDLMVRKYGYRDLDILKDMDMLLINDKL